ncbi:MAG: diguanylate cyclase [Anaerolineales bacterium]|nr:diguanylate cyclase [Anaerolineales bacterium]
MNFGHHKNWLRWKYITQFIVLLILSVSLLFQYLADRSLWRHLTHWVIGSVVAFLIIEYGYRKFFSLSRQLEEQILQSEQRIRYQKALIDLSSRIATLRDEELICSAAIQTLEQEFGYERAYIALQDPSTGRQRMFTHSKDTTQESKTSHSTFVRKESFSNSKGQPSKFSSSPGEATTLRIRAPLRNTTAQFGHLVIESKRRCPFTPDELSVVYAVANLVSISLQNVLHYKEQQQRQIEAEQRQRELAQREQSLALLNQITREALQARGFNSMIIAINERICQLFSADTCLFALWDEQQKFPVIHHAHGYQAEWINSPLRDPSLKVLGSALVNSARVIPIAEPSISPWLNPRLVERLESQSMLALPLIANERKLGVILISYRIHHAFSPMELAFGEQAANQIALAISKEYALEVAQHRAKELDALQKATTALLSTLDIDTLLGQILDAALSAIPAAETGLLHLVVPETGELQVRAAQGGEESRIRLFKPTSVDSYSARSVRQRRPFLVEDVQLDSSIGTEADFPNMPHISSLIVAPLLTEERVYGALSLGSSRKVAFTADDLRLLVSFAATATTALRNAQLHAAVQQQAITDPLTGLYNRRGFLDLAEHELLRAHRFNRPLSMILIDIDRFKEINDTYGHLMGDKILATVSANCKAELRQVDIVARYGGDEFIVLLPETTLQEALLAAERLRLRVEGLRFPHNGEMLSTSICLGVAEIQPKDTLKSLIERTDQALYHAKQSGRNLVGVGES